MKKILYSLFAGLVLLGWVAIGDGLAATGTPPDIDVSVALNKAAYVLGDPGDPVVITITVRNAGTGDVITSGDFSDRPFYLNLTFTGPDGKPITSHYRHGEAEGAPPPLLHLDLDGDGDTEPVQVEPVEILPGTVSGSPYILILTLPNANTYYALAEAGDYSVKASISMRTYPAIIHTDSNGVDYAALNPIDFEGSIESNEENFALVADADGDGYSYPIALSPPGGSGYPADCDDTDAAVHPGATEIEGDGIDNDCNPATLDVVVVAPGTILVQADKHTVGSGSHPGSTKEPIVGLTIRAFDKTGNCVSNLGVSWQSYKSIWLSCIPPQGDGETDLNGTASIEVAPGNYIVIAAVDPDGVPLNGDEIFMGVSAGSVATGEVTSKYLQYIVKSDGKKVPAKYTKKTGSELLIIEPEYVEWSGTEETYPFIFDAIGDWVVTTAVSPPEGFTADYDSLSDEMNSDVGAVQFTITDIGSKWVSTGVTHTIKHKGKSEIVRSRIGVKLSKGLAKKKGLGRFGHKGKK